MLISFELYSMTMFKDEACVLGRSNIYNIWAQIVMKSRWTGQVLTIRNPWHTQPLIPYISSTILFNQYIHLSNQPSPKQIPINHLPNKYQSTISQTNTIQPPLTSTYIKLFLSLIHPPNHLTFGALMCSR